MGPPDERVRAEFTRRFGRTPRFMAAAPGRVNLIGEHTDYNEGFVLPMALDRYTVVAADLAPGAARRARLESTESAEAAEIPLDAAITRGAPAWANYPRGVIAGFRARGVAVPGFDALFTSDVPLGGGLSSSAALEVATATLLAAMTGAALAPIEIARLCQRAEHELAGVPCGIMDQMASVFGQAGAALLIDCRSEEATAVPMDDPGVRVLVTDTGVKHALGDGTYARRRAECQSAARSLGARSLREVAPARLEAEGARLGDELLRRARHVVSENDRTLRAAAALRERDFAEAGRLMSESHRSLRDDFEVSCLELDVLVEEALRFAPGRGVHGARMTGGGFGGCTVTLAEAGAVEEVRAALVARYRERTGREAAPFVTRPSRGAHLVLAS